MAVGYTSVSPTFAQIILPTIAQGPPTASQYAVHVVGDIDVGPADMICLQHNYEPNRKLPRKQLSLYAYYRVVPKVRSLFSSLTSCLNARNQFA